MERAIIFYILLSIRTGAAVWIRSNTPFKLVEQKIDLNGRYALIHWLLDWIYIVLGSIYAPNNEQDKYLETLSAVLAGWSEYPWVLGGDF